MFKAADRRKRLQSELHRDLNLIILAVTFGMAFMTVYNGPSLNAFMRSLGAGDFVFSILMAMPVVTGMLQLVASIVLQRTGKRKKLFVAAGLFQRFILIPIALVPLLVPEYLQGVRIWIVLVLMGMNAGAQAFMTILFTSWVGALVPSDIRGRYFSRRALISTLTSLVVAPLSGLFLDMVPGPRGYAILFSIVAILGAVDIAIFIWVRDPPLVRPAIAKPLHRVLMDPLRNGNYRRFILFAAGFQFSLNLASSFFTPHMLEHLNMSMLAITLLTQTTMSLFTIFFVGRMGRLMDRYGTKPVITVSVSLIIIMPLFWLFTTPSNYFVVIFLVQMLSGMLWPSYEMSMMNYSIWLAPEEDRPSYLASYAFVVALFGVLPGQLIGGAIMENFGNWLRQNPVPWMLGRSMIAFDLLLILTFFGRLLAAVFLLPRIQDSDSKGTPKEVAKALFQRPAKWFGH